MSKRYETLVFEVTDPAVYDAHNPLAATIPGARAEAWGDGDALAELDLIQEKLEEYCTGHAECDYDKCVDCPIHAARNARGGAA